MLASSVEGKPLSFLRASFHRSGLALPSCMTLPESDACFLGQGQAFVFSACFLPRSRASPSFLRDSPRVRVLASTIEGEPFSSSVTLWSLHACFLGRGRALPSLLDTLDSRVHASKVENEPLSVLRVTCWGSRLLASSVVDKPVATRDLLRYHLLASSVEYKPLPCVTLRSPACFASSVEDEPFLLA